jgi:hypothetical protein
MIETRNLRKGNVILLDSANVTVKVHGLPDWEGITYEIGNNVVITEAADQFTAIELDADWFKRLGFINQLGSWIRTFRQGEDEWEIQKIGTSGWFLEEVQLPIEPEYVHELQNLYFSLTGEELI